MVKEFSDVFLEELSGLLLEKEVDLCVEILPRTTPICKALYRMAPTELKEFKNSTTGAPGQGIYSTQCFSLRCTYYVC